MEKNKRNSVLTMLCGCCDVCALLCVCMFLGPRGEGGEIVILEEAAKIKWKTFSKGLAPMLLWEGTCMFGISTPDTEDNYYSVLLDKQMDNGEYIFPRVIVGLICDACRANKVSNCPHRRDLIPTWQSEANLDFLRKILDDAAFQAETAGIILSKNRRAFQRDHINALFTRRRIELMPFYSGSKGIVFIAIDPAMGGAKSRLSIIAFALQSDNRTINTVVRIHTHTPRSSASLRCA
jgi:hypothetical protein